ncbi:MAG: 30S ribosomal protein S17e [Candidatus Hadarchaeaceae archaeon]|nr:30S ribosomal protein S17e [Hadesarchaea archaeon]MDH5685207.1 30S ribosomal protein S17e [Hadesarchaea archaeon]
MGRVRPTYIKRAARKLIKRYPDKFSIDFKQNCLTLDALVNIKSKSLRNRIAGYISNLLKQKKEV